MTKPAMYVIINKSLGMSAGKVAAQAVHAVMGRMADLALDRALGGSVAYSTHWAQAPHRWVIILEAQDAAHLMSIQQYLKERRVASYLVIDEGVNEIPPLTATALAVGPLNKAELEAEYLSGLKMYKQTVAELGALGYQIDPKYLNRKGKKAYGNG